MWSNSHSLPFSKSWQDLKERWIRVLDIWWKNPHACNRWLSGSSSVVDPELVARILTVAAQIYDESFCNVSHVRHLVPKQSTLFSTETYEIHILESDRSLYFPVCLDERRNPQCLCAYAFELDEKELRLQTLDAADQKSVTWLRGCLPKLVKWLENVQPNVQPQNPSLQLVDLARYSDTYQNMKGKYGKQLVQNWTERTDPQKFVYEDIAIASYLMQIWTKFPEPQSFVDVGCGNGLLVYLLNSEKHKGVGFDVRKRGIWEKLGEQNLIECAVDASGDLKTQLGLDWTPDWLIANHSDELTPWIPVMAARLGCSFFVLPCCAFDFYSKFGSRCEGLSKYGAYLQYVCKIGNQLGFEMKQDRLKIPSTKRTCFIGTPKKEWDRDVIEREIATLLKAASAVGGAKPTFEPRDAVEPIRNCTQLSGEFQRHLTTKVASHLLKSERRIVTTWDDRQWNCGARITLKECSDLLTDFEKQQLKANCGGLQTFLRNQHQVFEVYGGRVAIRDWTQLVSSTPSKTRPCWFLKNHADGCPLGCRCSYAHD